MGSTYGLDRWRGRDAEQLPHERALVLGPHERLADEDRPDTLGGVPFDIGSAGDTTESDEDNVAPVRAVLLLDDVRDPCRGAHVDLKVVKVAVVDPDDLGSDLQRPRELLSVVHFDKGLHAPRDRVGVELRELLVREHRDDEEDRVGAVDARFVDLVGVRDKVLAEDGGPVRESVNGGANGAHVVERALEPLGLREN